MKWRAYPAYRDSGVEWLGEIPEHWGVDRLKYIAKTQFSGVDKHTVDDEEPVRLCNYTDVYNNEYITSYLDFLEATATAEEIRRFKIEEGDVLVTKDSEAWNDIAVPAYVVTKVENVLCGYHLAQVRARNSLADGAYLSRAFSARGINDQFRIEATGITRYGLGKYAFENALFFVPSIQEQRSIAAFLDRETSHIDQLIAKKQRQIELLQEKRSVLISHVVTKGLDPNVKMKDSGVEWLGKIPAHWELVPLKFTLRPCGDAVKTGPFGSQLLSTEMLSGSIKVYNQRNVLDRDFISGENYITEDKFKNLSAFTIFAHDVLVTTRGTIGRCAVFPQNAEKGILHPCLMRIEPNASLSPDYLSLLIQDGEIVLLQLRLMSNATTIDVIYSESLKSVRFPLPPIDEQRAIMAFLDRETSRIDELIAKITQSIDLLREYRTALISAAVTGKIDVREEVA